MRIGLPPLTLVGARVLTGGALRSGDLGVAFGRVSAPVGAVVDLSGLALLPGAVDIGGVTPGDGEAVEEAAALAPLASRAGTTSLWIGVDWPEATGDVPATLVALSALVALAPSLPVDLGIRLAVGTHAVGTASELLAALPGLPRPVVALRHPPESERAAAEARAGGAGALARHLCRLASALDGLGVRYGTEADPDGERRERYSMFGARLALRPAARGAAASARAMEEPVVLAASDLVRDGEVGRGPVAMMLAEGLCDALASFGRPEGPGLVVRHLARSGRLPFAHAWALVSSAPAGILRLPDRGGLVEGTRADIAVIDPETLGVVATISGGALVHATPQVLDRFRPALGRAGLAAE